MNNNTEKTNTPNALYTVKEVAQILHTNVSYVYDLIKSGHLPALKLGSYKVRNRTLETFLNEYEGKDLTDPYNVKTIYQDESDSE